jgi:hypothetical protein
VPNLIVSEVEAMYPAAQLTARKAHAHNLFA